MENNESYELVLNDISFGESLLNDDKRYQEYSNTAALWLSRKKKRLFADEILSRYNSYKTIKEVLEKHSGQYHPGIIVQRGEKREQIYYDVWGMDIIEANDSFFSFFFACKLSHVDILQIDNFLDYHLENSFENNKDKFQRFLNLEIRRFQNLFKTETIETSTEWLKLKEADPTLLSGTEPVRIKGRKKREKGDNRTILSLHQTVLLMDYLQKTGIILNTDELNYKQAGTAFQILTGYSSDAFRLKLGSKYSVDHIMFAHEDHDAVYDALAKIQAIIDEKKYRKKRQGS